MRYSPTFLRNSTAALLALVVATGALLTLPASPAHAADVTWGVRTAENEQGAERQNYGYEIEPGSELTDAIIVTNYDTAALDLSLYAADGYTTEAGQLDLLTLEEDSVEVGAWVTLDEERVEVPPGESVEIPFTLAIPDDATPGDYAGGVVTSLTQSPQEQGISVDRRLGIRMHVRVGGDLVPTIAIDAMSAHYSGTFNPFAAGDATVTYTVRNTGNAILTAGQSISVSGPFGMFPAGATGIERVPELLPGESWSMTVPVAGVLPTFLLTAEATLLPELPADSTSDATALPSVQATATTWGVPWMLLLVLIIAAAAVYLSVVVSRRRQRREQESNEARVQAAVEAALREREERQDATV